MTFIIFPCFFRLRSFCFDSSVMGPSKLEGPMLILAPLELILQFRRPPPASWLNKLCFCNDSRYREFQNEFSDHVLYNMEENLVIKMLRNGLKRTTSTSIFSKYLHHGWRKFWILMRWNGLERTNSTSIFSKYLLHGRRTFWILILWNGVEWTNSTSIF